MTTGRINQVTISPTTLSVRTTQASEEAELNVTLEDNKRTDTRL